MNSIIEEGLTRNHNQEVGQNAPGANDMGKVQILEAQMGTLSAALHQILTSIHWDPKARGSP